MRPDIQNSADDSLPRDVTPFPSTIRVCPKCKMRLAEDNSGGFCPLCMLRVALSDAAEFSGEGSDASAPSIPDHRFEHYHLVRHKDGTPIELGARCDGCHLQSV